MWLWSGMIAAHSCSRRRSGTAVIALRPELWKSSEPSTRLGEGGLSVRLAEQRPRCRQGAQCSLLRSGTLRRGFGRRNREAACKMPRGLGLVPSGGTIESRITSQRPRRSSSAAATLRSPHRVGIPGRRNGRLQLPSLPDSDGFGRCSRDAKIGARRRNSAAWEHAGLRAGHTPRRRGAPRRPSRGRAAPLLGVGKCAGQARLSCPVRWGQVGDLFAPVSRGGARVVSKRLVAHGRRREGDGVPGRAGPGARIPGSVPPRCVAP